jgi:hypothetical protein
MTFTNADLLARVAATWLDIVPSRQSLAKRSLPPQANEPTPNVVVVALPTDRCNLELCGQFRQRHWKPRFDEAHVPCDFAWQIVAPGDRRLLLFTWTNWRRNSRKLFEDFCQETGREFGTLTPDGNIFLAAETIPLGSCRLLHESEFRPKPPLTIKPKSAKTLAAKAKNLLKQRTSQSEPIDCREFFDDQEAHDDSLHRTLERMFRDNISKYQAALTREYGPPTNEGFSAHRDIPLNGVMRYAVWEISQKTLYLALAHEDRELPYVIYLGVQM